MNTVYQFTLTAKQRENALIALDNRRDYIKRMLAPGKRESLHQGIIRQLEQMRQPTAEALHILREHTVEIELDASGEPLSDGQ